MVLGQASPVAKEQFKICFCLCARVSGWVYVHSAGTHRDQEVSDPLKQELQEVVIHLEQTQV